MKQFTTSTIITTLIDIFRKTMNYSGICLNLYFKLKDFEMPYVLSDRRYKDCAVLYYRYGGFKEIIRYDDEGKKEYLILDSDNEYIIDNIFGLNSSKRSG